MQPAGILMTVSMQFDECESESDAQSTHDPGSMQQLQAAAG